MPTKFLFVIFFFLQITIESDFSSLEITEAYPEDTGSYTVMLHNPAGEASTFVFYAAGVQKFSTIDWVRSCKSSELVLV
jgi:hypothetical protein